MPTTRLREPRPHHLAAAQPTCRFDRGDFVAVVATAGVFVSFFLPWYSPVMSGGCMVPPEATPNAPSISLMVRGGSWSGSLLELAAVGVGLVLLLRVLLASTPHRAQFPRRRVVSMWACALLFVFVLVAFAHGC